MDESLLQAKLHIPLWRRGQDDRQGLGLLPRPRLVDQLDQGLHGRLTVVSAPAGFGKTTLVTAWLEHLSLPAAWLSLDEDDNDFARFWRYFIAALRTSRPTIGERALALLQSSASPDSRTLITLLLNDLAASSEESILVLDDYHAILNREIDQALMFFVDHMPEQLHLIIMSRADPNLSLARLRAAGQLHELRGADLRFTPDEATAFLQQMTGLSLTQGEMAVLHQRTEGWAAGLQMAALSMRQREAAALSQFIENFGGSDRFIMDYLVDEVLRQQPSDIQSFLLRTSILDQLCGPLCEALLQEPSLPASAQDAAAAAQEVLERLEHENLFITPLDDQRRWYRYHHLFADLLRQRLQQAYPDEVTALHLAASQWYEQAGLTQEAVQHAMSARAFDRAAALMEQAAPAMAQHSELARLRSWLDAMPEDRVRVRPRLALYFGWGLLLSGHIQQAAHLLEAVEARLAVDETGGSPEVQGHAAALRAYLMRESGDLASTISLSRQALHNLRDEDMLVRAMVMVNLAIAYYLRGEFAPASELLVETIAMGKTAQRLANTLSAIYLQSQILQARGSLQQALQAAQEGLAWVEDRGWQGLPAAGFLYVSLGHLFYERNELSRAAEYLEKGIQLGQAGGHPHILVIGDVWLAWLREMQGDMNGSQENIHAAVRLIQRHQVGPYWPIPPAACYEARIWIAQGNLAAASRWAQTSALNRPDAPTGYLYEVEYLTLVRVWIAQGNLNAAERVLERLHEEATAAGRNGSLIEVLILQALTFAAQKHNQGALAALGQALDMGEPEGFVRIFLDEGPPMTELLRQAVAQGVHATYALRLLEAAGKTAPVPQPLIDPLTERELEVLRQVAAGYSNQEIAQELVLAISTIKKHINNIYNKLGVNSRTQAVAKARELGIL